MVYLCHHILENREDTLDRKDESMFRFVFKLTFNINYIQVQADSKLPVLYLIDSVIKNFGQPYIPLFSQNIVKLFASTFIKVIILYNILNPFKLFLILYFCLRWMKKQGKKCLNYVLLGMML